MKLIVQIPCHNEAEGLPSTLAAIPRSIPGVDVVEVLVIDDGSEDRTAEVAREHGADHLVRFRRRRGLAAAFRTGIDTALRAGADIIVNTDGDNQYDGRQIPTLVTPILRGEADMVVGDRDPGSLRHFSPLKRMLQRFGSWTVRRLSGTTVADSTSGFRAYSREAALRINVVSDFTYTLETLIQAGKRRLEVVNVAIDARHTPRESRLSPTMLHYLAHASSTMARAYAMYRPLKIFFVLGTTLMLGGVALGLRFLYYSLQRQQDGMVQSLILAAILSVIGFQTLCLGLIADLLASNRKLMEEALYLVRRREVATGVPEPDSGPVVAEGATEASGVDSQGEAHPAGARE